MRTVIFIHGGGEGIYAYDEPLVTSLLAVLGEPYHVIYPPMPTPNQPDYDAWKTTILQQIDEAKGDVVLVGHSFGASILVKVLAEEVIAKRISGVFLLAAPYWSAPDWEVDAYALSDGFADALPVNLPITMYHCQDDEVVPIEHLEMYMRRLPRATIHKLDNGGHQFNDDLAAVAADIRALFEMTEAT